MPSATVSLVGHRANYLLLRDSGYELFFSHWGANRVGHDLFWGPLHAEEFVRRQTSTEHWLDDVWCEGGACLDFRSRELLWFAEEDAKYDPYVRAVWQHLMGAMWEGWTIRWAERGIVELAERAGVPREKVLVSRGPGREAVIELNDQRRPGCHTLATLNGQHYTLRTIGWEALLKGPALVEAVKRLKGKPLIDRDPPCCGIEIEEGTRTIRYWALYGPPLMTEKMESAWAGWTCQRDDQRAFGHLAGLDVFTPPPEDEVLHRVVESLSREIGSPVDGVLALVADRETLGHKVEVNPSALVDARHEVDSETRALLLALAVEHYWGSGGAPAYPR